jgi:endonuclease/exonuclease/phosphatase family metal-dependent hydrolase
LGRIVVRTWNLFHGNAKPPERRAYLEQMVRLACTGGPDLVCLQELPAFALDRLGEWSGMQVYADVAQPPRLGPLPISATLGGAITSLNNGLFRSAVSGQANAILVSAAAQVLAHDSLVLNARDFRERQGRWLRVGLVARLAWTKERRVVQVVRARFGDRVVTLANLHTTSFPADQRLADAELLRAAVFVDGVAGTDDVCVLAGDFNVPAARSATQEELQDGEWGFSAPLGEGIDQILVRGARVEALERWPRERRVVDGRVLSDHTPVEATLA